MLNPGTPQNARNHEELNNLLRDINTLPEGANPYEFENIKLKKISDFLKSESSVGINVEDFVKIIKSAEIKNDLNKKSFSLLIKLVEPDFEGCFLFVALVLVAIGLTEN